MTGTSKMSPGPWTWTADFTGLGIIICWGGGESGASGVALSQGGKGGDSGALSVDVQQFVTGQVYSGYNGYGGALVDWGGGSGNPGLPGESTYFGGGTTCKAPGGGSSDIAIGRARIPQAPGVDPVGGDWEGGKGGDAPSQGDYPGGLGGENGTQGLGDPGEVPGGGGSGGGQNSNGDGSAGANGGTVIIESPDSSLPGYFLVGLDEDYNFSAVGTYDDFVPEGNGFAYFECVGSGGGGRGGNGVAFQGGHGASGGAHAWRLREVFKDVSYRRVVPAGGAGTNLNGGAGANGADASWTLTPLRVVGKQLTSNVATIYTCAPGSSTPQKHGLLVGEQVTIANVDATFNGTFTVTAVAADRLSFSYAKTASNVAFTAVTPGTTAVTLTTVFCMAKGGLGATGTYTGGTPVAGGDAGSCIGDGATSGDRGQAVPVSTTTDGGSAGGGALPLGEQGGWGGSSALAAGPAGDPGGVPGGGGGGGRGLTSGNGGAGGRGAAVVRWILELHGIWVGEERQSVTRVTVWTGSPGSEVPHEVIESTIWDSGSARSSHRVIEHPESLMRRYPDYLPENYRPFFDRVTGCFNWKIGAPDILPGLNSGDFDIVVFGDSVSEGWTFFDGLVSGTADMPKAFPRLARDYLSDLVGGLAKGGTGLIRTNTVIGVDPQWSISGWSASGDDHYVTSSTVSHVATFTPGLDSQGIQITGDKAAIVYSGGGITVKNAGGTTIGTGAATGSNATLARLEISLGSTAGHVIKVNPTTTTQVCLFGVDVYKTGIRVHNMSQGGSKSAGGTGQGYWGPASGMTAPTNMTACYTKQVMVPSAKGFAECYLIFLGGNDSNSAVSAADIKAGFKRIVDMIQAADADANIVLMPDVWTSDRQLALMDLCMEESCAMIDFFYLSRALTSIFGLNYNGDPYGHLNNTTGAQWAGGLMRDAFLYDPF